MTDEIGRDCLSDKELLEDTTFDREVSPKDNIADFLYFLFVTKSFDKHSSMPTPLEKIPMELKKRKLIKVKNKKNYNDVWLTTKGKIMAAGEYALRQREFKTNLNEKQKLIEKLKEREKMASQKEMLINKKIFDQHINIIRDALYDHASDFTYKLKRRFRNYSDQEKNIVAWHIQYVLLRSSIIRTETLISFDAKEKN